MSVRLEQDDPGSQVRVEVELRADAPLERLRGLRAASEQVGDWRREVIAEARRGGLSWAAIGEALGVSKQAAWAAYNADVREVLAAARERSGLTDEDAQALADQERDQLRDTPRR